MRCGCPECGEYMIQAEGRLEGYCVCAVCGYQCNDCLGRGKTGFPIRQPGQGVSLADLPESILEFLKDRTE